MSTKVDFHNWKLLLLMYSLLLTSTGCSSLTWEKTLASLPGQQPQPTGPVVEIMGLWQPGEGRDPQGLPCRGFAGQLFFFQQGSTQPAKITGDVKIYVFDDHGNENQQAKPIHCYEFKNDAWQAYLTETNIGNCYQVFIPYPRPGDQRAICSLRIKWTGSQGETLLSDPADVILAGRTVKVAEDTILSEQKNTVHNSLSNQQTHIARIGRTGKSEIITATNPDYNQQKNIVKPNVQQASYLTQLDESQNRQSATEFTQVDWNRHEPAAALSHSDPADETLTVGWTLHHNLPKKITPTDSQPLNTIQPESPGEVTADTFQHPLLSPTEKTNKRSSLKIQTITLD